MIEKSPRRVIPLQPAPRSLPVLNAPATEADDTAQSTPLRDRRDRPLRDLRISVTDRCNFRCSYCMPKEIFDKDYPYLPHAELLSFEEITRVARQFVAQGVEKIRLTGGEPLLRKDIEQLIAQLATLRTPQGNPLDLTLTTNGSLLTRKATSLREAGLRRLTVSLDGLDDAVFRAMNDVDFPVQAVLEGIDAAQRAGFSQLKVNMVVQRGVNEHQVLPMAKHFRGSGIALRFIEYMDVGNSNGWKMDQVVPSAELLSMLQQELPLIALPAQKQGETAQRWGYLDANGQLTPDAGELGFISSVTQAFCHDCNRARLSTQGQLFLCLFAHQGFDLKTTVRTQDDAALARAIRTIWQGRDDRYSELRGQLSNDASAPKKVEMSYIGG